MVSHDRYLIERVTDDVVALFGDGRITHLPGGDRRVPGAPAGGGGPRSPFACRRRLDRRCLRHGGSQRGGFDWGGFRCGDSHRGDFDWGDSYRGGAQADGALARNLRRDLRRLDRALESLRRKQSELTHRLAAVATNHVEATAVHGRLRDVDASLAELEERWLEVAGQLEEL